MRRCVAWIIRKCNTDHEKECVTQDAYVTWVTRKSDTGNEKVYATYYEKHV